MKNRFAVRSCCYCKAEVAPGAGSVWKWRGRWYGKHAGCSRNGAGTASVPPPATAARVPASARGLVTGPASEAFLGTGEAQAEAFAEGLAAGMGTESAMENAA